MKRGHEYNRVEYLLNRYTATHITTNECVSKEYKAKVDKTRHENSKRIQIEYLLNEINNPHTVRDEVHDICKEIGNLKILCRTCKVEQIIAVIILYVQRIHNNKIAEEKTRLWNHYDLSWKLYSRIIARLLVETRKNRISMKNKRDLK